MFPGCLRRLERSFWREIPGNYSRESDGALNAFCAELRPPLNQNADVDTRKVIVKGHVSYISSSPSNGLWSVDIALRPPLPESVGEDLQVDATIHLGILENILYVGRPAHANQNSLDFRL